MRFIRSILYPDVEFAQLFRIHLRWRARHQIDGARRLREGDDLADRRLARQDGDDTVQPEGDAAVRRRAVLERLEEEAEAELRLLLGNAEPAENPRLERRVVDSDTAAADFRSVQHEIVRLRAHRARLALQLVPVLV